MNMEGSMEGQEDIVDLGDVDEVVDLDNNEEEPDEEEEKGVTNSMEDMEITPEETKEVKDDSILTFRGHTDAVHSVVIHPSDSSLALSGGQDDKAYLWSTADGKVIAELEGHTDTVLNVGFSPDGKFLATASMDATVRVYKVKEETTHQVLSGPSRELLWMAWAGNAPQLIAGSADHSLWLWNYLTGEVIKVLVGHEAPVSCGAFSSDGKRICTASEDGTLFVWGVQEGKALHQIKGGLFHKNESINCLAMSKTQPLVLTGDAKGVAKLSNWTTGKVVGSFAEHKDSIESVGFCHSLKIASTASIDSTVKIWDLGTQKCRSTLQHPDGCIKAVWHSTDPLLYTSSNDHVIRLWDCRKGTCVRSYTGHTDTIHDLAISKDGRLVLTASDDHTVRVFKI